MSWSLCLNAFELQYLVMVAERRNCGKQPNGVTNRRCDKQNDFSLNLHGVMGEYAVAKLLGLRLDHTVGLSGDDKIADLRKNGHSIQVKTNMARWKNLYLYFNDTSLFRADIAVLATIKSATEIDLPGWIDRERFLEVATEMNFGYGPRIGVEAQDLRPPEDLKSYVAKSSSLTLSDSPPDLSEGSEG